MYQNKSTKMLVIFHIFIKIKLGKFVSKASFCDDNPLNRKAQKFLSMNINKFFI
jgi:hypothetical protein